MNILRLVRGGALALAALGWTRAAGASGVRPAVTASASWSSALGAQLRRGAVLRSPVYRPGDPAMFRRIVPEIAVPSLPDVAMATMTAGGPVILYDPALYRATGSASEFVRAHEYGHVLLGHLQNERMISTDEGRAEAEAEADCFAARHVSRRAISAMVELLRETPADEHDAIYGTKPVRARRILACAGHTWG